MELDASFEEVQDARNFLVEQYKGHEASRESIELAFDDILQEKIKLRAKFGFKPPQRGKYGEAKGDELVRGGAGATGRCMRRDTRALWGGRTYGQDQQPRRALGCVQLKLILEGRHAVRPHCSTN